MPTEQIDTTASTKDSDSPELVDASASKVDKTLLDTIVQTLTLRSSRNSGFSLFSIKGMIAIATAMIAFGQFNDTKELLTALYENITTNFTHSIQYNKLDELAIGRTIGYVEEFFGPPEVIKISPSVEGLIYQYYNIDKAVICIMNYKERVAGFVVIPLAEDFTPTIRYSSFDLGSTSFFEANEEINGVFFDANNLVYYSETVDLGKQYMFLQQVTGYVEYGNLITRVNDKPIENMGTLDLIREINDLFVIDNSTELDAKIGNFRNTHAANFFGYTELDPGLVPESLLTRFEFKSYFGEEDE